uniref:Uncharacterized protein n=1 Tax=Rhizophora mucronata TaxID=61149 RepID=A0A2P2LB34_RHIMU
MFGLDYHILFPALSNLYSLLTICNPKANCVFIVKRQPSTNTKFSYHRASVICTQQNRTDC